jgi:cob(I)alamin adenosyltransferase
VTTPTKIYTRTGDEGETALFGGGRVPKNDPRVEAYGDVDEANAVIGVAQAALKQQGSLGIVRQLTRVQEDLFAIGAYLATPGAVSGSREAAHLPDLPAARIAEMEGWIDEAEARLPALRTFILPGGTDAAARLHEARTVCRRAERRVVSLTATATIDGSILIYLNRLSDLLFTLARLANLEGGGEDVPWSGRR